VCSSDSEVGTHHYIHLEHQAAIITIIHLRGGRGEEVRGIKGRKGGRVKGSERGIDMRREGEIKGVRDGVREGREEEG
jgi:hypothetical protein